MITHTFWRTWRTQRLPWATVTRQQWRQRKPRPMTSAAALLEETWPMAWLCARSPHRHAESWRCCSPSTRSCMDASNEPPGKAEILQVYAPASRSSRWLMIKACSLIATLSFRNVSWIVIPNCWWETRMMVLFSLNPHWTWVIWSFSGPGMNLHGKETFCRRYPVTTAGDVILWAWKTAQRLRHQHHLQRVQSDEQFSKGDFAQSYKVL